MKKIFLIVFFCCIFTNFSYANNFIQTKIDNHTFRIIKYDTKDDRYNFIVGVNPDYNASSLRKLMEKYNAISAVNGVFLCPADYRECGGKNFTKNERYFKGYKFGSEKSTGDRVVFGVDKNKEPFLFQTDTINKNSEKKIYYGLANFPLILKDGVSALDYYEKKGMIDRKMSVKGTRNFICSDKEKQFIYTGFVYSASMQNLPNLLTKLGCYDALNLDAGKTSSLIYNGRQVIYEKRQMLDGVLIERKGLDVASINKKIDGEIEKLYKRLESKYLEEKIIYLENVRKNILSFRKQMYHQNSRDSFDEKGKKIGYEIQMNGLKNITIMYFINYLDYRLAVKLSQFKKEQKRLDEVEGLLF